ncbi:MAG: M3 family oligoendopeptidase [Candidatus Izimaplasma sp.]|nr:M3 family oligoendopeptidase [Candidatus Izimaplasma bacterium]
MIKVYKGGIQLKTWNLDALYSSFDSEAFQQDLKTIELEIKTMNDFAKSGFDSTDDALQKLVTYLNQTESLQTYFRKAFAFCSLSISVDAGNKKARKYMNKLQELSSNTTYATTRFTQWLPQVENLDEIIQSTDALNDTTYFLTRTLERAKHVLSDKEEAVIAKMKNTGSSAWSQLQGELTSTLKVDYDGKQITLSEIRNLSSDKDQSVRKKAYEAEQKAYPKIERAVAYAMNGVKGEVNTLSKLRGYDSPLAQAVEQSRMKQSTLDALLAAMKEYLPVFRKYLKRKGSLLGHNDQIPYYDLFAPLGKSSQTFSEEEAMTYIFKNFKTFSDDLEGLARRAWDESWIDFTPRDGKRGGAFCSNLHPIKQSRILTNFTGSFSNVITLAHELGHAYHGDQIFKERPINSSYTMPVAETASTFCETIVKNAALEDAKKEEKIFILEQSIMGSTQVIVDIYSRFLFESNVFETRKDTPLNPDMLKEMMLNAQKEAYGDALDEEYMHAYAWLNKPHYYIGGLSFYNFPYAFGLLFAKGIYAAYKKEGSDFVGKINLLLQKTGQMSVEDVAALVGLDVADKDFWKTSLDVIKDEIELFLKLTK